MNREKINGFVLCANGEPCAGEKFMKCPFSPRNNAEQNCGVTMARIALSLLKEQEAEIGHWIIVEYDTLTCSCCGESYYTGCDSTNEATANLEKGNVYRYCPYCGAKMEGR